jgi:hypothetical protein
MKGSIICLGSCIKAIFKHKNRASENFCAKVNSTRLVKILSDYCLFASSYVTSIIVV